jgi:8-oxo-dGTP pyrophosphatase MutT (NUDIX family)
MLMKKETVLFKNKWVSVIQKDFYIFARHDWCNSLGVALLPYRKTATGEMEFLGRFEIFHAHGEEVELCAITGGYDKEGESFADCAARELKEEGGYIVSSDKLLSLGTSKPSKAADSTLHLFAVEITEDTPYETPLGDGTIAEEGSYAKWLSRSELLSSNDPNLLTILVRLEDSLR